MLTFEDQFFNENIKNIAGCDEAGRGPLCGPVVAAAVILPSTYKNEKINDSKKLKEKDREELFLDIKNNALAIGIGIVEPIEIDKLNIYQASKTAMLKALKEINIPIDMILTDYMPLKFNNLEAMSLVKGDAKARCIAAASIIAKVTRDHIMDEMAKKYPEYNFDKHKGYPTKEHLEILKKYGIIKGFYRESYNPVKEILYPPITLF